MIIRESLEILTSQKLISPDMFGDALKEVITNNCDDIQKAAFLGAISCFDLTSDHILEAVKLLRKNMITVNAPDDAADCCGTGGDASNTGGSLNISTATAFIAARSGLKIAKHGNRSVSSRSGSADVLEEIGYEIKKDPKELEEQLKETNLCFLFAPYFHPVLKSIAQVRKSIGIKTFFNMLGPMLNPANVKYQIIGVYDFGIADKMLDVLEAFDSKRVMIVQSSEGADELTLSGDNKYRMLFEDGKRETGIISPTELGLKIRSIKDIQGGNVQYNAEALKDLLNGKQGAYRETVNLNAGTLLYVANKASSIQEGINIISNN